MRILKKALSVLVCICSILVCTVFPATEVLAATGPTIQVGTVTAVPLDTVIVNVDMVENTGVMAMTFTISYNPEVLTYSRYYFGVFNDYTVVDHPDRGYISFVNCESSTKKYTGSILALEFQVKQTAPPGFHEMKIRNIRPETNGDSMTGCFANWKGDKIVPTIINGGITVGETCNNMGHTYGEWQTTLEPKCEEEGIKTHSCTKCGHSELASIPAADHIYQDFWTIDREATAEQKGVMSRHCEKCDAVTDKVYFSLPEAEENNFSNTADNKINAESWDKLQQIVDKEKDQPVPSQPEAEPQPEEEIPENISPPPSNEEPTIPDNALELIENTKKQSNGLINRIYKYFLGGEDGEGLISLIKAAAPDTLKGANPFLILLPALFLLISAF